MNPYTYGKRRVVSAKRSAKTGSWTKSILNAPVHIAVALLFVLFAASSVASMAVLAYPEIASVVEPAPQVALGHTAVKLLGFNSAKAAGQVLDAATPRVGQLVYEPNNKTVYLVGSSGLYGFTNAATFYAWGYTSSQVLIANSAELGLPVLSNVPMPQSGCSTPLLQIAGACTTSASNGSSNGARVGQIIYNPSNKTIYLVGSNGLYGFPDAYTFYSWGFAFGQVVAGSSIELALPQIGIVPVKISGCSNPLSQINNSCTQSTTLAQPTVTGPATIAAGSVTTFVLSDSSPYGTINYSVNWGDSSAAGWGSSVSEPISLYHIWSAPGRYGITVTATDAQNNTASKTLTIQVTSSTSATSTVFQLSKSSYNFTATQGDVIYQQQSGSFVNVSASPVGFSLSVPNQPSWFNTSYTSTVSTATPGTVIGLGAGINPTGLVAGTYTSAVQINGNFAGSPIIIPVTLVITPSSGVITPTLTLNQFSLLPATVGQTYNSNAITFSQTGSTNPILVTFSGLPNGIGMPETMKPGQVFNSEQFSQYQQSFIVGLTGVPTQAGSYNVTLTVSNQSGLTRIQSFVFVVQSANNNSSIRVGQLIFTNGGTVYLVGQNGLYGIPSLTVFNSCGWSFSQVVQANAAEQSLSQVGLVTAKVSDCASALDQITGNCGFSTANTPPGFVVPIAGDYSNVQINSSFGFNFSATDAQGGMLSAKVNWGDPSTSGVGTSADMQAINSQAGVAAAFARFSHTYTQVGSYLITVTVSDSLGASTVKTAPITVIDSSANFTVAPASLAFTAQVGGSTTGFQSVSVTPFSSVSGWTAQVQSAAIPGLNLYYANVVGGIITGSGGPATFNIGIVGPFTAGTYTSAINVISGGLTKIIPVTLTVTAGNSNSVTVSLSSNPSPLSFTIPQGSVPSTANGVITFTVSPNLVINWTAQSSANWVTVPSSGTSGSGATFQIGINSNAANLAPGTYYGPITITSAPGSGVSFSPQVVNITLVVNSPSTALPPTVSTASLTVNGQRSVTGQVITVNVGDTLNYQWSSINAVSADSYYSVSPADSCGNSSATQVYPWVANTTSGTYQKVVISCMAGSNYIITYRVYNPNAAQVYVLSTLVIKVNSSSAGGLFTVSPSSLSFAMKTGQSASLSSSWLAFATGSGQTASWAAQPSVNWLTVSTSGIINGGGGASVGINYNANSLPAGSYSGIITFSPLNNSAISFSPQTLNVILTVLQ